LREGRRPEQGERYETGEGRADGRGGGATSHVTSRRDSDVVESVHGDRNGVK
jgi:hypothetical protein